MNYTTIKELYNIFLLHPNVVKDSREITKDCIYFSLKGESFDGNTFAKQALEDGAAYAVIDNKDFKKGKRYLLVEDCLKALQALAILHRNNLNIPILAISGSNGKTTTKELIAATLNTKFNILYTLGNYNNHIGVPLTILRITTKHEIAIIEMGANHQKEIEFLCTIAQPTHGLLTNIGKAHLEGFGGEDGIEKGKTELFKFLETNQGIAFINIDDEKISRNIPDTQIITYGLKNSADCTGTINELQPSLKGSWKTNKSNGYVISTLYGEYNFYNILAACCIANYFKVESSKIDKAIYKYRSNINRSEILKINSNTIYLDAYNANPTSMELSLLNFISFDLKNKIVILGDMFEVGAAAFEEHKNIVTLAKTKGNFNKIVFVGSNFLQHKNLFENAIFIETTSEASSWFKQQNFTNCSILLKGSRGMRLEQLIN